jgi:4-hydroxyphenylpyruvate dioxygenase
MGGMATTMHQPAPAPTERLTGWDHLELWVGNARAASHFLMAGFGFTCEAYAGPETGQRDRASYLLVQGDVRLVVTAGLALTSPIAHHVLTHGDGVHAVCFAVEDVDAAFTSAVDRGAPAVEEPHDEVDEHGAVRVAAIRTYGETLHRFVDRRGYTPGFGPRFRADGVPAIAIGTPVGIEAIDHVVGNVEEGRLDEWVRWYEDVFGFTQLRHFDADQISTEFSALRSTVVWNGGGIKMPINEPAEGRKRSQIQEYLDAYVGAGVQHVALGTSDIVTAVDSLRRRGIRFLTPPATYYDAARERHGHIDLPWDELARLGILVDEDQGGHLLQVFTETVSDRPTLFMEIIQREGATGFGEGNFKALFEAIEREQAKRGNL